MTYDQYGFLDNHPVFRREEFVRDIVYKHGLSPGSADGRAQKTLSEFRREKRVHKLPKGIYVSSAVMEEAPDWLPYAVAGCGADDAVLGLQAALWLHLGKSPPEQLRVFSSTLKGGFIFDVPARKRSWEILPIQSIFGSAPSADHLSVPGIIQYKGKFQHCPLPLRATTAERTLVDILDGLARRPRKPLKGKPSVGDIDGADRPGDDRDGPDTWPSSSFMDCWEALSSEDLDLDFDAVLQYLECQQRSKATTAKLRFFFTIHQERYCLQDKDLRKLTNLPDVPHRWTTAAEGTLFRKLKLIVPNSLIPDGYTITNPKEVDRRDRLKNGVCLPGLDLIAELNKRFGNYNITEFRDGQEAIVKAVLEGRDAMAILPTGSGKSLTYQFPSTLLTGPTLVISPLISLMNDQVREARQMNLVAYAYRKGIKSTEIEQVSEDIESGALSLLFVSPESWPRLLDYWPELKGKVAQIVVDEAHLITTWGQDFRFNYQNLGKLRLEFKNVPILALSATATGKAQSMIAKHLRFRDGYEVQIGPVKRPNLYLQRLETRGDFESRYKGLLTFLEARKDKPGIVYCVTKKESNKLAARLREELYKQELDHAGISSVDRDGIRNRIRLYHAGQKEEERESAHQAFLASDCRLIVATVAFGMGVNKRNIRHVVHFGPPPSLENYVQEVGRAGRDSFWSECLLIHSQADWVVWRKRLEQESGRSREDETPMGRSKRKQRLERIRDRLCVSGKRA
jgi:DEAD/DEAH box helicase/Helicase conserved C-terminal domain